VEGGRLVRFAKEIIKRPWEIDHLLDAARAGTGTERFKIRYTGASGKTMQILPAAGMEEQEIPVAAPEVPVQEAAAPPIRTIKGLKLELAEKAARVQVTDEVAKSKVLIVVPEALSKLTLAWAVSGPNNRPLLVEALAEDPAHKERVELVLRGLGIAGVKVHDMKAEFPGDDSATAASKLSAKHRSEGRVPFVVKPETPLEAVLAFLDIPAAIADLRALWFIVDQSNQLWT